MHLTQKWVDSVCLISAQGNVADSLESMSMATPVDGGKGKGKPRMKRRQSFFGRSGSKSLENGGAGTPGGVGSRPKQNKGFLKSLFGMADEDDEMRPTAMEPMPRLLTVLDSNSFRAKEWDEERTRLEMPVGNADLLHGALPPPARSLPLSSQLGKTEMGELMELRCDLRVSGM